jgi:hypothetical protein
MNISLRLPGADALYGNTLATLVSKDIRKKEFESQLREGPKKPVPFSIDEPVIYNPYPDFTSKDWKESHSASYVPCKGPTGELVDDILVFKGHPHDFPAAGFGSYDVLNLDGNLCFERETRLGIYGFSPVHKKDGQMIDWDNVNWGDLQRKCFEKNKGRFDVKGTPNPYIDTAYPELNKTAAEDASREHPLATLPDTDPSNEELRREKEHMRRRRTRRAIHYEVHENKSSTLKEPRTAILLRAYTGKKYTDNDKQNIRSIVSELSLRTGGQFHVFLWVQVREAVDSIWDDEETYQLVLNESVPREFHGMTKLWNDEAVWKLYPAMQDENSKSVHTAQWLSVQKFSQDHPEYNYVWNWEMDARYTGHHYDLLGKLEQFAKKQPRRGLWERNERYYIPSLHGDYDTDFRKEVEERSGKETVWGPPPLPFIRPIGPKPPVSNPENDNYEWGVGEDADVITIGPIFNPVDSNWVIANHVWGYSDETHGPLDLPRRTTIITQSRVSKRLLDIMHVENSRGNHVASEMTPQTVALLHGLKAVFAPHPVFFDRPWNGTFLDKWFNPGPKGVAGGTGSAMGWGREKRYQGSTWYYRTEPPMRMYNHWIGYEDWDMGGPKWERKHGRPCLPPIMLHPIKDVAVTEPGFRSHYDLAFG